MSRFETVRAGGYIGCFPLQCPSGPVDNSTKRRNVQSMNHPYRQKTLEELRADIVSARPNVGKKGAPHAIDNVARALRAISARHGVAEANRAIVEFDLDHLGWRPQSGEEPKTPAVNPVDLVDPLDRIEREP